MDHGTADIHDIDGATPEQLASLPFGVIGIGEGGDVEVYSATESRLAGLSPERVMGKHFFTAVAPCMNNLMVAHRMDEETEIDATIDYVLTLRMKPTPVKLRMLKRPGVARRYILIQR